jgi:3-hydroxyisobutyrate dehydrogenase
MLSFIGLGQMGVPMVRNLLRAGHPVRGYDRDESIQSRFADDPGFTWTSSSKSAAHNSSVVILMLPDSNIVDRLLWDEPGGLATALAPGSLLIDMGSSDPVRSRANHLRLQAQGIRFVDAPVSGGVKRAIDGSLSIMIGGDAPAVAQARPILQAVGKTLVHVGHAGAGHAVKALNNYVSASGLLAVCEALIAAEQFGIDPKLVNQVFNASTGKNNTTEHKVENFMLSGQFNSGFALALMRKDLDTARGFIDRMGTPGAFAELCFATWAQAEQTLAAGADHTALYEFIRSSRASSS